MGLYLIGAFDWNLLSDRLWMIGSVAFGLGFVIFVHELGHFLVAKWCGVKCEKFYVGFDVPIKILGIQLPSKLVHFQWGETEYGIGIIPLGGYVKMLGQDDDPRAAQQEMERIRIKKSQNAEGTDEDHAPSAGETAERSAALSPTSATAEGADEQAPGGTRPDEEYELDPRSFPAKTVPQRMGIISAGVIMNLIFAVIFAAFAFRSGVDYTPCEVGGVVPGSPAWTSGMEPGSRIIQVGEGERRGGFIRFDWDLSNGVNMVDDGEQLLVAVREADGKEKTFQLLPDVTKAPGFKRRMIGVAPAKTTQLSKEEPTLKGTSAAQASPPLEGGDTVTAIDGTTVADAYTLTSILASTVDHPVTLTVQRKAKPTDGKGATTTKTLDVIVQPNYLRRVGLVMKAGPIVAIRPGSPAEAAGFQLGDVIETISGEPMIDPMSLPTQVRPFEGQEIEIAVRRGEGSVVLKVTPRTPDEEDWTFSYNSPMASRALGLAFQIEREVVAVRPGSPAANAEIKAGDQVAAFKILFDDPQDRNERRANSQDPIAIDNTNLTWPFVFERMQGMQTDETLSLSVQRGPQTLVFEMKPEVSSEPNPHRGFWFATKSDKYVAESWTEAFALGAGRTWEDANRVVLFLKKLVTRKIALSNVGGPLSIAYVAGSEANAGWSRLLIFLTFLSANLAVVNFLPIPALDGGHFMFLCWEGISGKPVNERVQIALTLAGVACLLCLMLFVVSMDINRLFF